MKKSVKKIVKILLLIAMIFSDLITPIRVFADVSTRTVPNKGDIGINGTVSDTDSVTVSAGAVRNEDGTLSNEGDVSVIKTLKPSKDKEGKVIEGRYTIEFNIKGKEYENVVQTAKPVYVAIVFDKSGSMSSDWKWLQATLGANEFANELLKEENLPNASVGLITFSSDASELREFQNSSFTNPLMWLGVLPNGGTNLHAGLKLANNKLSEVEDAKKYVVVMSDGEPTYYVKSDGSIGGDGNNISKEILEATYAEAAALKDSGVEIFSIGYELESKVLEVDGYDGLTTQDILRNIASEGEGHFVEAKTDAIVNAFTNIATSISKIPAGTDATLTDNIGDKFKIVGAEDNVFTINEINENGTTVSFEIEIDDSKVTSDGWYNTNEGFTLTYTDVTGKEVTIEYSKDAIQPQVWLTAPVYEYTVNYYKDNLDGTPIKSDVIEVTNGTSVDSVDQDKYLDNSSLGTVGYEFSSVSELPVTITDDSTVINVLYTIKKFSYDVNYFYDGVKDEELSNTISNNIVPVSWGTEVNANSYYEAGIKEGYSLSTGESTSGTVVIDKENIEINIYYIKNSYKYNINYHFNGETGFSKNDTALFGSIIKAEDNYLSDSELEENNKEEYFINPVRPSDPNKITIGTDKDKNVINIYYVSTVVSQENMNKSADKNEITSGDTAITYTVDYTSVVSNVNKDDTVTVVVTDTLPFEIDENESDLDVIIDNSVVSGVYNKTNKTITWTFEETMNEFVQSYDASKTITYTVVYKNVGNGDGSSLVNSVVGTTTAGGKTTTGKEDSATVNVKIPGEVIVHHYVDGTTTSLVDDETLNGLVGESYTTSSQDIFGYTLSNNPNNASGTYTEEDIVVTYYYTKNNGVVENTEVVKNSTNEDKTVDNINSTFNYTITATGEVKDYVGDVTVVIEDTLPYELTEEAINGLSDECKYDSASKTITCTRVIKNIDEEDYNSNGVYNVNETFNLGLTFVGVNSRVVTNNVKVTIKLDSNVKGENTDTEDVTVKDGSVIVHHYVDGTTTSLVYDETLNGLVGEGYTTSSQDIFGYTLSNNPNNASGTYTEEDIVVTYYYTKNNGVVENTEVVKNSTNEDKTVDNINSTFNYTITATGEVKDYVGDVTVVIEDTLPYELTEEAINGLSDECKYDSASKTITCTRVIKNIDKKDYNSNGVYNVNETFNLGLTFADVTDEVVTNNAKVIIKLDGNVKGENTDTEDVTVSKGNVVVVYKDNLGNIFETIDLLPKLAGSEYTTEEKEYYGYSLTATPNNKDGIYLANQTVTVNYIYRKNPITISDNSVVKEGPSSVNDVEKTFDYTIKYNATIKEYIGGAELKLVDTLPFGAVIVSMDNRCTYDNNKTITCRESYNINKDTVINETFNISLKYVNISFKNIEANTTLTNNVVAEFIYGNDKVTNNSSVDTIVEVGTVSITYKDALGNELASEVSSNGLAGSKYTTEEKTFFGYTLTKTPDNASGEYVPNQTVTVNYVYSKNDGEITEGKTDIIKISNDSDKIIESVNDVFGYTINTKGEVKDYIGDVTVVVVDTLPYELTEETINGLSNGCKYDSASKTITCTRIKTITESDYINGVYNVNETFKFELTFVEVTEEVVVNNAKVTITLDSNVKDEDIDTEEVEVEKGRVVVTYKDTLGNELYENIILEGLVGNKYNTEEKTFYGYTLTKTPDNASEVYTKEDIVVEYVYSKNVGSSSEVFVKEGSKEVANLNAAFDYIIKYNTTINDYVGEATLVITDELPYEIDTEKSIYNTQKCEYADGKLVCTYTKNITKEDNNFAIDETFSLYYINVDDNKVTNKANAILTYGTTTKTNDSEYTSEVKTSTVTVNYVTEDGNKLTDSIILTGMVGDKYSTEKKLFDKYNFIKVNGEVEGIYTEDNIEVTYVYDLTPLPPQTGVEMNLFIFVKYLVIAAIVIVSGKTYKLIKNN